MKICYINNLVYILVLFLLALILYNGFMNKINYDKNIERFHNKGDIVTLAIDRDGTVMSKTPETEMSEETREAVADVSENTQRMEQILNRLEKISTEFNQSIEYNEEIVNEYNKILEDINYISDADPNEIYQFLADIDNNDIINGVEILKNIIKSQIDKKSVVEPEPEPEPQPIENYTYIGKGYCQLGYLDRVAPGEASKYHSAGSGGNKSLEECAQLCNDKPHCKYMSYVDNSDNTRNNICSLYGSQAGDCENINNRVSDDSHLTYKKIQL